MRVHAAPTAPTLLPMPEDVDRLVRLAAFTWLGDLVRRYGHAVPRRALEEGVPFRGERVRVIAQQGIFIPKGMTVPLSITTAPERPGVPRPYEDEVGHDGLLRYRYRGTDPSHRENVGLRVAHAEPRPLVWFFGLVPALSHPVWPVYVVGDDPAALTFTVASDMAGEVDTEVVPSPSLDARRLYATAEVKRRLHQSQFRQRVLHAYRSACAICNLRHGELLDAAHILPDGHPKGEPVVPNGLALCKIHHAAFDHHLIGVRPDLVVEVRQTLLDEEDGPMLRHGLQACHGQALFVPHRRTDRPHPDFLEERYRLFREAG